MRMSAHRFIFPLLISISLTGAGVILIYFINKKTSEDEERNKSKKSKPNSIEIMIPRQFVPAVIGRGGSMIKTIQHSTDTTINFKDESDINVSERTCIITGKLENIKLAEEKIKCILNNQLLIETYETLVPQGTIAKFLEQGGRIMNQIQNSSNAKLIFPTTADVGDPKVKKRVIIKGTAEQIADALLQIEDKVREYNEAQATTERSSLTRVPRFKTSQTESPEISPDISSKDAKLSQERLGNHDYIEVFVTAVNSPSHFYVQIVSPRNAQLDPLIAQMTEYYEDKENREFHALKNISVGQVVSVKFPEDGKWYRAEVIADCGNQNYEVYFADFGDQSVINQEYILELRTDFLSLKLQAVECSLAGVLPRDGEWSKEAIEAFSKLSAYGTWKSCVVKIRGYKERILGHSRRRRSSSPVPYVELYEKHDNQLVNLGKELIKLDYAVSTTEPWSAGSSAMSLPQTMQQQDQSPEGSIISVGTNTTSDGGDAEENDLTLTPKPNPLAKVCTIDLTTPAKENAKNNDASRDLIESERNVPWTTNGSAEKPRNKSLPANPFKSMNQKIVRNIIPAGFEDELSQDSDEFEYN